MVSALVILAITLAATVAIVRAMIKDLAQADRPPPPIDVRALKVPITIPGILRGKAAISVIPAIAGFIGAMETHGASKFLFALVGIVGLIAFVALSARLPSALVVDADGVAISTSRGVERFRFDRVASMDVDGYVFTLRLVDGSTRWCRLFAHADSLTKVRAIEALLQRSREPRASPRAPTPTPAPAPSVELPRERVQEHFEREASAEPTVPAIPGSQFRVTGTSALALAAAVVFATVMIAEASVRVPFGLCVAGSLVAALAFGFVKPPALTFGEDGVVVGAERVEFLPYSVIDSIGHDRGDAIVFTHDGRALRCQMKSSSKLARLLAAFDRSRAASTDDTSNIASITARGEKALVAWIRDLKAVTRDEGYRAGAAPIEDLWRVVEDPGCDPSARAGAAIALQPQLDAAGVRRLRVAAKHSAAPLVRVAIAQVVENADETALEEALAKIDEGA
jgi:hypothetical protein